MYPTEGHLQTAVVKAIIRRHPTAWVFHPVGGPFQAAGVPDLLVCVDGLFIGIELKNPRPGETRQAMAERVTPRQRAQIRAINKAGGTAGMASSVEEALELVDRALRREGRER